MIFIGLDDAAKDAEIGRHCAAHAIKKVVILSPEKYRRPCSFPAHEHIEWADIIEYRFYYRLLQEIDSSTLVVVNECLRTQKRNDLTYNCIRLFLQQTPHVLVFQYLPLIDTAEDFAVLFDFDTKSRWKREAITPELLREARVHVRRMPLEFHAVPVVTDAKTKTTYAREKAALIAEARATQNDPHTIPRNLYLLGGKAKAGAVSSGTRTIGRNTRLKLGGATTYKEPSYPAAPYTVVELPHSFLDFADFLALSQQTRLDVLVADLPVDVWYFERYQAWLGRIRAAYDMLDAGGAS